MTIQVAMSLHDRHGTYARHAGVTLQSLLQKASLPVCAHVLHDETLTWDNRRKLEQLAVKAGGEVVFHSVRLSEEWAALITGAYPAAILFRLLAPDLLAIDKVIHMDCDVVCELDIAELWQAPLGECCIGAVLDRGVARLDADHQARLKRAGLNLKRYFNSGVLVMDLARLRSEYDLVGEFVRFLRHFPDSLMLDQDFLNWLLPERCCYLPEKYNTLVKCCDVPELLEAAVGMEPRIWHFSGLKPWERYESKLDRLYWLTLAQTPWREELVDGLMTAVEAKLDQVLHSRSWRMTAPYRAAGDFVRSRLGWFR